MIQRCENPRNKRYALYGGRGIRVCDEWRHDFGAFSAYVGQRPTPSHSIDRIDNDADYAPGNVRWATASQQMRNRRPFSKEARENMAAAARRRRSSIDSRPSLELVA